MDLFQKNPKTFSFLLISTITLFCFYNSLAVPFYLDDIRSISNNAIIHSGSIPDVYNIFGMRFFAYLSFWVDYQIVGSTSPVEDILTQLHITSILIHMLNGFVVFSLAYVLAYKTPNSTQASNSNNSHLVVFPLTCALLFIVHPLHSQAVTYIVQRTAVLVSLFYLVSLLSYLWLRLTESVWQKTLALLFTLCFAGLAFFTKQNSFTLPIAIVLLELIFFNRLKVKHFAVLSIASLLGLAIAYILDSQALTAFTIKLDILTRESDLYSRLDYFLAQLNILWIYIAKFIIPYPIRLEYPYHIDSFPLWQTVIAGTGHLVVIGFAFVKRKQLPLIAFGILFYYTAHMIESGLVPIADLAFEHRTYLPDFGLVIIVLGILHSIQDKHRLSNKYTVLVFIIPIIVTFALMTGYRNTQWGNPISFYQHELSYFPNSCRLLNNLANQYEINGDKVKALELAEKCIELKAGKISNPEIINNYVALLVANKQYKKADIIAIQALEFVHEPINRRIILENLGMSKLSQKQYSETEKYLKEAVNLPSPYPRSYFALSIALLRQKKFIEAKKYVLIGLSLEPNSKIGNQILLRL